MRTNELTTCFCTSRIAECRKFYESRLGFAAIFDCGWYISLRIGVSGPAIQFMQPRDGMLEFSGAGVTLNFLVDDVDAEHQRITRSGLTMAMPFEDHPWGDRGFSVIDPLGNSVYIYSERDPGPEFKQYFMES